MNRFLLLLSASVFLALSAEADILLWDGAPSNPGLQDGAGPWNTTVADRWYSSAGLPPGYISWDNTAGHIAVFGAGAEAAGNVTLEEAISAGGLIFNAPGSGNYTLIGNGLTLTGSAGIEANVNATITSALAGTSGLTKSGAGTLTLNGSAANTLSGAVNIEAGTLTLAKNTNVDALGGTVQIKTGGTLLWGGNHNQLQNSTAITVAGGAINFNNRNETFASYTQSSGGQTGNNAGTMTITGSLAISGGTLLTLNSGARWSAQAVDFSGWVVSGNALLLGGDSTTVVTTFGIGSGGLTLSGQTLSLNRTTTAGRLGNQILLEGNVTASGTNTLGYGSSAPVLTAGAVNLLNLGGDTRTFNITSDTTTINLTVSNGGLTKTGAGTLSLSGVDSNLHTGLTTVSNGTLLLAKTAGQNAVGGDIRVEGGTLRWSVNDQIPDTATITVTGGLTFNFSGRNETFANYIQTGGQGITASSANSGTVVITGTATLSGGGTMTVNSGGTMTVNKLDATGFSGTVINIGGNSAARISSLTIEDGGLVLTGQSITLNKGSAAGNQGSELRLLGNLTASGTNNINTNSDPHGVARVNLGDAVRTVSINSGTTTSNAPFTGSGGILKTGAGTLRLTVPTEYTGKTTLAAGTLTLSGTGSLISSPWIQVDSGATLDVSALGGGFTYSPVSGTAIFSGSGQITGSLILGQTLLSPGASSDPAMQATAGDGIGTLNITGDLTVNPAASQTALRMQIQSSGVADQIVIGGALSLSASSNMQVEFAGTYVPVTGDSWTLVDWGTLLQLNGFSVGDNNRAGADAAGNEGNLDLPDLTPWGLLWEIEPMVSAGSLTVSIVPEPSRSLLVLLSLAVAIGLRRRAGHA